MCVTENVNSIDSIPLAASTDSKCHLCTKTFFLQERDKTECKYDELFKAFSKQLLTKLDEVDDRISLL